MVCSSNSMARIAEEKIRRDSLQTHSLRIGSRRSFGLSRRFRFSGSVGDDGRIRDRRRVGGLRSLRRFRGRSGLFRRVGRYRFGRISGRIGRRSGVHAGGKDRCNDRQHDEHNDENLGQLLELPSAELDAFLPKKVSAPPAMAPSPSRWPAASERRESGRGRSGSRQRQ